MASPMPELTGVEHRYATVNGARLHYAEAGEGRPLLLVHGWPQNWWMWREFIAPLAAKGNRLIVPDLRGYGWSEKTPAGYRKTDFEADTLALLDELGIERVSWVGHDWGAVTGLLAAIDHPERIERFASLSVPHPWSGRFNPRLLAASSYQLMLAAPLIGRLASSRAGVERRALHSARALGRYSDEELDVFEAPFREPGGARVTVQTYRSFLLHDLPRRFAGDLPRKRLTVPTLWMVGERDPVGRFADESIYRHADDVELVRVPHAGHFLPEEDPDAVLGKLFEFLA